MTNGNILSGSIMEDLDLIGEVRAAGQDKVGAGWGVYEQRYADAAGDPNRLAVVDGHYAAMLGPIAVEPPVINHYGVKIDRSTIK